MKLLRFGPPGQEQPGMLDAAGNIRSLAGVIDDIAGDALSAASLDKLRGLDPDSLPLVASRPRSADEYAPNPPTRRSLRAPRLRLGPCVGRVGKMMCIGLNYSEHAAETGAAIPEEPILFMKATSAIVGPNDDIRIPRGSTQTDWEVELGVVIGEPAKYVSEADALNYVAGYCVVPRRLRALVPERPRRPVDQRQKLRHLRPHRPLARHQGRSPRPAKPEALARSRRRAPPGRHHRHDDLRRQEARQLPQPVLHAPPRRHHLHRHALRRRHGHETADLPPPRPNRPARRRRPRRTTATQSSPI